MIGSLTLPPSLLHGIYVFFLMLGVLGTIAPNWGKCLKLLTRKKQQRLLFRKQIEEAYLKLRNVCEPGTLNPEHPGNQIFMKAEARDFINPFRPGIKKSGFHPPGQCTTRDRLNRLQTPSMEFV